jgi:hypothetical protein
VTDRVLPMQQGRLNTGRSGNDRDREDG